MTEPLNDAALVHQAQRGDMQAFERLVETHSGFVYNLALRLVRSPQDAEDIAQEVFIRVWKALPGYRANAQFNTWLYRIVSNTCYDRLPALKRELNLLNAEALEEHTGNAPQPERIVIDAERSDTLVEAITHLPESYRLLIILRHVQSMSYAEIAAATGQPLGTVKTGIHRARAMLAERLEGTYVTETIR